MISSWEIVLPFCPWSEWRADFVLRSRFQVPPDWPLDPDLELALLLPLGEAGDFSHPEALVYVDGAILSGTDRHHQEVSLRADMQDGEWHSLALHGWTGLGLSGDKIRLDRPFLEACCVAQVHRPLRAFIAKVRVALGIAEALEESHPAKDAILNALDASFNLLDTREPFGEALFASLPGAMQALEDGLALAGPPLDVDLLATGHAHIDVAWLWPLGQTRRKASRTFANVLRLMERDPGFHFTQSQPQLYEFIRQDHPELFNAIQRRIAEGRWEPIGGMWVEADCNLSGAELLARQFLLGRGYFHRHFGPQAESPVLWLPDVFGYAWALPQLIRLAGLKYFFTIKIGWSQYNRLPYDAFWWQGLDGTRVLTHFSTTPDGGATASTYNAMATPAQALDTWRNFQQKEVRQPLLMSFGYGDGGGGPTWEMIENLNEMQAFPAAPRARQSSVRHFYELLEARGGRAAHLERRAVPGAAPRHLHHAEPQQAPQPAVRVPAARRRVPGCHGGAACPRLHVSRWHPAPGLGVGVPEPVPRHPARQQCRSGLLRIAAAVRAGTPGGRGNPPGGDVRPG